MAVPPPGSPPPYSAPPPPYSAVPVPDTDTTTLSPTEILHHFLTTSSYAHLLFPVAPHQEGKEMPPVYDLKRELEREISWEKSGGRLVQVLEVEEVYGLPWVRTRPETRLCRDATAVLIAAVYARCFRCGFNMPIRDKATQCDNFKTTRRLGLSARDEWSRGLGREAGRESCRLRFWAGEESEADGEVVWRWINWRWIFFWGMRWLGLQLVSCRFIFTSLLWGFTF
ncbi:hypothetical protein BJ508DRAFT_314294 [Ascobolus immersus RN42]|uniref:Uncharacterized protein n=1 Tax=Ascobolus immersus RN42 TaxID=1160509 RepID=A0A3N4HM50_ASCIM|nr:hypothetical protein BJ508DRAFT_314294 [Ascobolus immersus RN42]